MKIRGSGKGQPAHLWTKPGLVIFLVSQNIGFKVKIYVVRSEADHGLKLRGTEALSRAAGSTIEAVPRITLYPCQCSALINMAIQGGGRARNVHGHYRTDPSCKTAWVLREYARASSSSSSSACNLH